MRMGDLNGQVDCRHERCFVRMKWMHKAFGLSFGLASKNNRSPNAIAQNKFKAQWGFCYRILVSDKRLGFFWGVSSELYIKTCPRMGCHLGLHFNRHIPLSFE
jgi:hypothetical protein